MKIREFKVETWLNPRVDLCKYNFGSSCVKAFTVEELFECIGLDSGEFLSQVKELSLHYGDFFGLPRLREALSGLYESLPANRVLTMHGGTGANSAVLIELLEPGDNVVAFIPNYQQHYSIPESLGIKVRYLALKEENGYLPDLSELSELIDHKTKMLTLSNPNNPTGAFIGRDMMKEICGMASAVGAYVLSDEIYRGLGGEYMPSVVDVYDKGIATCSTSKVFSMAGARVGWIVTQDKETHARLENRRSYDTICGGVFDELIVAIGLEHKDKILERSRKIVRENREIFDEWLPTQPRLRCKNESWGSTAFVHYDSDISSVDLCEDILGKASILLCHGDCFETPKSFRLGYGFMEPETVKEGLAVLGNYFTSRKD